MINSTLSSQLIKWFDLQNKLEDSNRKGYLFSSSSVCVSLLYTSPQDQYRKTVRDRTQVVFVLLQTDALIFVQSAWFAGSGGSSKYVIFFGAMAKATYILYHGLFEFPWPCSRYFSMQILCIYYFINSWIALHINLKAIYRPTTTKQQLKAGFKTMQKYSN